MNDLTTATVNYLRAERIALRSVRYAESVHNRVRQFFPSNTLAALVAQRYPAYKEALSHAEAAVAALDEAEIILAKAWVASGALKPVTNKSEVC